MEQVEEDLPEETERGDDRPGEGKPNRDTRSDAPSNLAQVCCCLNEGMAVFPAPGSSNDNSTQPSDEASDCRSEGSQETSKLPEASFAM